MGGGTVDWEPQESRRQGGREKQEQAGPGGEMCVGEGTDDQTD